MTTVINLTPHTLNIYDNEGNVTVVEPSGRIARVGTARFDAPDVAGIPVTRPVFGPVEGLPDPEKDTIYIVSGMVLSRVTGRDDVYAPGELVRDDAGRVIGCKGLSAPENVTPHGFPEAVAYWYNQYAEVAKLYSDQAFGQVELYVRGDIALEDIAPAYLRTAILTRAAVKNEERPAALLSVTEGHDYEGIRDALANIGLIVEDEPGNAVPYRMIVK